MKNDKIDVTEEVKSLVAKAVAAKKSDDALKFSQAAVNAANAMACLRHIPEKANE